MTSGHAGTPRPQQLSESACAVIAALTAPETDINARGVMARADTWAELREHFPLDRYWQWQARQPEDLRYHPEAED